MKLFHLSFVYIGIITHIFSKLVPKLQKQNEQNCDGWPVFPPKVTRMPPETMLESKGHAAARAILTCIATCGLGVVWAWAAA